MYAEGWRIEQYARTAFEIGQKFDLLRVRPNNFSKGSFFVMLPPLIEIDSSPLGGLTQHRRAVSIRISKSPIISSLTVRDVSDIFLPSDDDGIQEDMAYRDMTESDPEEVFARRLPHHYVLKKITKCLWSGDYVEAATEALNLADSNNTGTSLNEVELQRELADESTIIAGIKTVSLDNADLVSMRADLLQLVETHKKNGTFAKKSNVAA